MGIPTSGPSYIYGDNMSIVHNISRQKSVLRKKSNSVCYQKVHESVVMGESLVGHIPSKENVADLMKVLNGQKRRYLVSNFIYDFMIAISYQFSQTRLHIYKLDPMSNSINLEGTRKMQS